MFRDLNEVRSTYRGALASMKKSNKEYLRLKHEYEAAASDYEKCSHHLVRLNDLRKMFYEQKASYSENMTAVIEGGIQHGVNKVAPTKNYKVKLTPAVYRGKNILKIHLIDSEGRRLPPKIIEGDMLNQVLSFSAVVIIAYKNGCKRVYYDEAFASANLRSLIIIRSLIRDYVEMGVSFVFVSQNPLLLAGLGRHVVELVAGEKLVKEVLEYDIDEEDYDTEHDDYIVDLFDQISKGGNIDGFFSQSDTKPSVTGKREEVVREG